MKAEEAANRERHGEPHGVAHSKRVMLKGARANKDKDAMHCPDSTGYLPPSERSSIHKLASLYPGTFYFGTASTYPWSVLLIMPSPVIKWLSCDG